MKLKLWKRILAVGLTFAMIGNTVDFSSLSVMAKTAAAETVRNSEYSVSEGDLDKADNSGATAGTETVTEKICLQNVEGELNANEVTEGAAETTINGQTEIHATLEAAFNAISEAGVESGESADITLKVLKNIENETFNPKEINGTITIDLNGCEIGNKGSDGEWQTGAEQFGFIIKGGAVTLKDSGENQTGYLHGTLQVEGGQFSMESGDCENLNVSAGTAILFGGACRTAEVNSGAVLRVTGDTDITTLKALHMVDNRADITLSGGHFGAIAVTILDETDEQVVNEKLSSETKQLAIEDMLASNYTFYNSADEPQEIDRTITSVTDLTVRSVVVAPENAAVRIDVTKKDGTALSLYYSLWKAAIDYLSDKSPDKSEFGDWQSVKIVLLKDVETSKDVEPWVDGSLYLPAVTVCSENGTHTLTGSGYTTVLESCYHNITLQNIKIEGGFIEVSDGNLTLEDGVVVSGAPYEKFPSRKATIILSKGELKLENAKVIATTEENGFYAVDLYDAILRMSGQDTELKSAYIADATVTAVIDANSAAFGVIPAFYGTAGNYPSKLKIFYTGRDAKFDTALKNYTGESEVWYQITLGEGAALAEDKNADTVTSFEDEIYGLYNRNKEANPANVIYVGENVCRYKDSVGLYTISSSTGQFIMPASKVEIDAHNWGEDGKCQNSSCGIINIAKAYENKALTIEGLEGRTYDSYPQILSKITWTSVAGDEEVLTAPIYDANAGRGTFGFGGDMPANNPDYTVVYKNNVEAYSLKPGDAGFDATKAPQVTITGKRSYVGSITIYFTIGKGEMRLGNFDVCGAKEGEILYDGNEHKAWNVYAVEFKADEGDKVQFSQLGDEQYIQTCNTTEAQGWYGQSWSDPNKVEYSTDDQKTWIVEKEFGVAGDQEKMYMITDAGEYPFYIRVTNKSCGELISDRLTAKITPRDLTSTGITFDNDENSLVTAYYTGKPIIPTAWDDKIVDTGLKDKNETSEGTYTLVRDKDFVITAVDNTDISTDGVAKATITGTGNYKGELSASFRIKPAFTLKQTSVSTDRWYMNNPAYWKKGGVPVVFSEGNVTEGSGLVTVLMRNIVYRDSKEDAAGLSGEVEFYTSLEDAVAGTNPGYTFTKEGTHTQTLYGKDPVTGYISEPVDVTIKIDTTAPTWEDENGNTEGFGIRIQENWWRKLLNTVSFGHLYNNNTLEIKIKANDKKNGVNAVSGFDDDSAYRAYYCYVQKVDEDAAGSEVAVKTKSELDALQKGAANSNVGFIRVSVGLGNTGTVSGALSSDGNYIVYAYAVDCAGNMSDYISTEGIVVDTKEPVVTVAVPKKEDGTLKDTEATLKVELNEDATLLYFYVDESMSDLENADGSSYAGLTEQPNGSIWQYVKPSSAPADRPTVGPLAECVNGKWEPPFAESGDRVTIAETDGTAVTAPAYKMEAKKGTTEIPITGLQPSEKFQIWVAAIDKAGNFSGYSVTNVTTTKALPEITTLPVVSGTYGDKTEDLQITQEGVAKYNDTAVAGTWSVSVKTGDTHMWEVNDTEKCQVTFTPDESSVYEEMVIEVTPAIEKRPITVNVQDQNMSAVYGEELPQISSADIAVVNDGNGNSPLVGSDSTDTIAVALTMVTQAKKGSDAGTYDFTVESGSLNYAVTVKYYQSLSDTTTPKTAGTLTITKAIGEIKKGEGFDVSRTITYGDAAFSLLVTGNHSESKLVYAVSESEKTDKTVVADDRIILVDGDGNVTGKAAGTATVTISLPESKNYTAAEPVTVQVTVKQGALSLQPVLKKYLYLKENPDTVDIASMLPKDCGEVAMNLLDTTDDADFFSVAPVLQNGKLSYTVKEGKAGDAVSVQVEIKTDNYGSAVLTMDLQLVDQKTVRPDGEVTLVSNTLTYGETLSRMRFNNVTFVDETGSETVSGTLSWVNPDDMPAAGAQVVRWKFTPDNEEYAPATGDITVTVQKAVPKVTKLPAVADTVYHPAKMLLDSELTGGAVTGITGEALAGTWNWQNTQVTPVVDNEGYIAVFTPDDTANYAQVTKNIAVKVAKATPVITGKPSATEITYGDSLGKSALTGGTVIYSNSDDTAVAGTFTWKDSAVRPVVADSNSREFTVIFTPADNANYEAVETQTTIQVRKAAAAPDMPGDTMNVSNGIKKVSEVSLPENWVWQDADKDTALEVGIAVNATAVYTGADKGNYETESVSVVITRSACDHKNTGVRNTKEADCGHGGYTGDTYCKDCGVNLTSGTETAALGHSYTSKVTKNPTVREEGEMTYTCSRCGHTYTEAIQKLQDNGTDNVNRNNAGTDNANGNNANTDNASRNTADADTANRNSANRNTVNKDNADKPAASNNNANNSNSGKPYIKNDNGKAGWELIAEQVKAAKTGETIAVEMNGTTTVPSDLFEHIKGSDINVVFDMGNGIEWTVNGKDVTDIKGDIDFGVTFGTEAGKNIPVDVINSITGEHTTMNLTLEYNGEFGFTAALTVNLEEANAGYYANLFYYNTDDSSLEFVCAGQIGKDGNVNLTFTHASDYTIVIAEIVMDEKNTDSIQNAESTEPSEQDAEPASQDSDGGSAKADDFAWRSFWIIMLGSIVVVIGLGIFFINKKKKSE